MKIAIVGSAISSSGLAPYDDPDWTIWAINGIQPGMTRWNAVIDLHNKEIFSSGYIEWMKLQTNPIYLKELIPEVTTGVVFPKDDLVKQFGNYFTNSISWATAFAITQKPEEIGVWGVDMAQDAEYANQRPSCEFYLGLAVGMGIKVHIPNESELLKCAYLYGYNDASPFFNKMDVRRDELNGRIAKVASEVNAKTREQLILEGARENMDWVIKNWKMNA